MSDTRVVVIGAGIGGLVSAALLAAEGCDVTVLEAAAAPGGKMREVEVAGRRMDAGPTVFTMRWVFEAIFERLGTSLSDHVTLQPAATLARHAWGEDRLDLFVDRAASAEAVASFSGREEANRYLAFCAHAKAIYDTLEHSFMSVERPSPVALVRQAGVARMWQTSPFSTMWQALGRHFTDPRLRQLFGRYATYCGSSPFVAPATLMLIAHVEQEGVWLVEGGMHRLAQALAGVVAAKGGTLRYNAKVAQILTTGDRARGVRLADGEVIEAEAIISNVDTNAIATGRFGEEARHAVAPTHHNARALSAVTWNIAAPTSGFPLLRHNVFFSSDYAAEFDDILVRRRLPREPTVYVCAQDRNDAGDRDDTVNPTILDPERLLVLVNAPATGDTHPFDPEDIAQCQQRTWAVLNRSGLELSPEPGVTTTPAQFERLFPATGGALYGRATHGAMASFSRPGSRAKLKGLYLTGGSVHPGAGVPMAALSGRIAADSLMADFASMGRSRKAATPGGMSMR
jgi:1-hydroxycarotenoid 3,4-desaturase